MHELRWIALFSGQGGQRSAHAEALRAGLPADLRECWEAALGAADARNDALDDAILARNRVAQPTIVAWQAMTSARLAQGLPPPVVVAGYSVGELGASIAAGCLSPATAIGLAATRAAAMDAAATSPSGLVAVLGLERAPLTRLCVHHHAWIAIANGPRHFVVGGALASLAPLAAAAQGAGATRVQSLPVTVAAHTPLLVEAVAPFAAALHPAVSAPRVPILSGIDAVRLRTAHDVADALARQLATPLDWRACMEAIGEMRPAAVLEVGPCNALARMVDEALPDVRVRAIDDFREVDAAIAWVARR